MSEADAWIPRALTPRRLLLWTAGLLLALGGTLLACSLVGHYPLPHEWTWRLWESPLWTSQIWHVRLFRLLAAATVGLGLATAGLATQGLLRNPLAEPYLLGISSGAGVGVLLGMAVSRSFRLPEWCTLPLLAFVGAMVTTVVVYGVAQRHGRVDPLVLLLSGVIINVCNGALILVILQVVQREQMIQFVGWGMGQVPEWLWFRPALLVVCAAVMLLGWAYVFVKGASYNTLGLGDEVAASTGVGVHRLRTTTFLVVSIMTSAAVALAGPIGFVGLIVPHVCRLLVGPDHRLLAIVSGLGGAIFLMAADTTSRGIGEWLGLGELPVGVVTALSGGPFFIVLLRRRLKGEAL